MTAASTSVVAAAALAGSIAAASLALGACARSTHVSPAPHSAAWHPTSVERHVDAQSPPLCSADRLPQPKFYARSAEMRPEDTLAVAQLGRCLASPVHQDLRVVLSGTPDRGGAGADARLPLERAARVEQMLVDNGVAPQRISIAAAADRPDLDGSVDIGVLR